VPDTANTEWCCLEEWIVYTGMFAPRPINLQVGVRQNPIELRERYKSKFYGFMQPKLVVLKNGEKKRVFMCLLTSVARGELQP
jgi:hypothetical protein